MQSIVDSSLLIFTQATIKLEGKSKGYLFALDHAINFMSDFPRQKRLISFTESPTPRSNATRKRVAFATPHLFYQSFPAFLNQSFFDFPSGFTPHYHLILVMKSSGSSLPRYGVCSGC
jgi:hypothetical protein